MLCSLLGMTKPEQCCGRRHLPSGTGPYGSSQQPLRSRKKLASPTVMEVQSLCCLLSIWSMISTLVCHAAHQGGMGCDNPLTMPGHRIISGHVLNVALSWSADMRPTWGCPCHRLPCQRGPHGGKEGPATLKDFLCLSFSFFLPSVTRALPWPIKGKAGHPSKGISSRHRTSHHITAEPLASNLEHIAEQQPSSQHRFDLSIRDLGPVPLARLYPLL